jgi:uncharacterized protein
VHGAFAAVRAAGHARFRRWQPPDADRGIPGHQAEREGESRETIEEAHQLSRMLDRTDAVKPATNRKPPCLTGARTPQPLSTRWTGIPLVPGGDRIAFVFFVVVFILAILSGATATVVGFGIGSMMTPLLALRFGTTTAVALVTLPHAAATAVRCWRLRAHVDQRVLLRFGLLSAAGALAGALIYTRLGPGTLTRVLGGLLLLTAVAQLTGWASRWQPHGPLVALFGLLSGFFGGIAGNQGGLRSAALTAFGLPPLGFVATATATGLLVDAARTPVYLWHSGAVLLTLWAPISVATVGVLIGTIVGERLLLGLSPRQFGQTIGWAIGALGIWMLVMPV